MKSLLSALTLDEKLSLVYGSSDPASVGNVGYLPGVPRLGIPSRRDADALGIEVIADATALPARLGLGATFDRAAVHAAGELIGNEGRALGVDLVYGPQVDLARLPNWIRNNTTFGEDPFLSGQLAIEEVSGIQDKGLMSEVKHFAIYNGQAGVTLGNPEAPTLPTIIDDQTAHELYLKAYEYPLSHAMPSSIMASYQGFRIVPLQSCATWATDNPLTLTTILRSQWGFTGFVLSDYGATHDVHALLTGLDQEFPGTALGEQLQSFFAHHLKALVDPTSPFYDRLYALRLDAAVAYVLYAYQRFGLLDGASAEGPIANYVPHSRPNMSQIRDANAAVTEQLSEKAAVLLKNEGNILPLKASDLSEVAIIGPTGRQVMVYGGQGERARGFPDRDAISPLQILQALSPKGSHFVYVAGIDWIGSVVPAENLSSGLSRMDNTSGTTRVDRTLDYGTSSSDNLKPGVKYTWTGKLIVPTADMYYLWIQRSWLDPRFGRQASVTLQIDGVRQSLFSPAVPTSTYPEGIVPAHGTNEGVALNLDAGSHTLAITAAVPVNGAAPINLTVPVPVTQPITFRFAWSRLTDSIHAAVAAAKSSKIAIVFADDNGEADADLVNSLAPNQDRLIEAVAKENPNTIIVLSTGNPVLMPWLHDVKAVLEMWYPGQEGGTSIAKLLLGEVNPGGRLPISWPANGDQTPFAGHPERINGDGKGVPFSEGIY
ncbi:MAG: glycoside hydrolase family 3 protein, partial [Verrucomicrobia bacterium]|nr:glycoside hydrolase family 3 protein [Verrucomicrobiota bacterium]